MEKSHLYIYFENIIILSSIVFLIVNKLIFNIIHVFLILFLVYDDILVQNVILNSCKNEHVTYLRDKLHWDNRHKRHVHGWHARQKATKKKLWEFSFPELRTLMKTRKRCYSLLSSYISKIPYQNSTSFLTVTSMADATK